MNLEFWSQGLQCKPQYSIDTGGSSETWGSWTQHDALPVQKECLTIGLAVTSHDPRLKHVVVAVVRHALRNGELFRLGCITAVTAVLPGSQTFQRGWFYGLKIAGHFVDLAEDVRVHVMSTL